MTDTIATQIGHRIRSAGRWYVESCAHLEPAAALGMFGTGVVDARFGLGEAPTADAQHISPRTVVAAVPARRPHRTRTALIVGAAGLAVLGAALMSAPPSSAASSTNAADEIAALQSQGYNVGINWGAGRAGESLSLCHVSGVDGLRGSGATPGTSVYVTVVC